MFHLDNETGVPVMPNLPPVQSNTTKWFTEGGNGIPPSWPGATWFNITQAEMLNVLVDAGIDPDKTDLSQLSKAIKKIISDGSLLITNNLSEIKTSGPDAVAATLANIGLSDVAHLPQLTGVIGTSRNARMSVTAASATATFTADELIVQAALGGRQYKLANFNKTINLATSGAGGMDTGPIPATGFVALYAIYNPTTQVSALLAVNATSVLAPEVYGGANMPSGYTASALVSVWGTAASLLKIGFLSNRHVSISATGVYSATVGSTASTALGLSATVPLNAASVDVSIGIGQTTSGSGVAMSLYSSSSGVAQIGATAATSGSTSSSGVTGTLPLIESQRLYYSMSNTTVGSYSVACRGYEF
ncbi:hypothetical protein [Yersinia massiliensis]|uniref:hypothetical protein n=1 Tax=Yersinia massiliensis TaxID=419257 RepID=UPI001CFE05F0|nr:hypothetical protein [Yersinia massiliensis]MCB5307311.1 hypothetical protein [Yersinia massiliensis]